MEQKDITEQDLQDPKLSRVRSDSFMENRIDNLGKVSPGDEIGDKGKL